jgi:hypothetical protein
MLTNKRHQSIKRMAAYPGEDIRSDHNIGSSFPPIENSNSEENESQTKVTRQK